MKQLLLAVCLASGAPAASAQTIDIQLGQSDYYGRIDLANFGTPQLIYKEPIWVNRPANYRTLAPVYLRVPPGHAKNWSKHCARYDACGRPAYFVQDSWYSNTYAPRYRKVHGGGGRDHDRGGPSSYRVDDRAAVSYGGDRYDHHDKGGKGDKGQHGGGNGNGHGGGHKDKGGKGNGKH